MKKTKQAGMSSFLVLGVGAISLILILSVAGITSATLLRAANEKSSLVATQAAQAGLELEITKAFKDLKANRGDFTATSRQLDQEILPIANGAELLCEVSPLEDDLTKAWVTSTVTYKHLKKSLRSYITSRDVSIWNNAIFGGTGAAGQSINGNVDIRGSMHLLGEGEAYSDLNGNGVRDDAEVFTDTNGNKVWDPGEPFADANNDGVWNSAEPYNDTNGNNVYDPPLTVTDMSSTFGGNAFVGNNYSGMPAALRALVPTPPKPMGIEQLGAEVRVKHGKVSINGSASIGTSSTVDGGASKGKVDGVYVNDGFTGNSGASAVHSDNGTSNAYDLGNLGIKFPLLNGIGAETYVDSGGNSWDTQKLFLDSRALTIPVNSITDSTPSFSYGPDAWGNRITFVAAVKAGNTIVTPATINITGVVRVQGDLQIGSSKSNVRYTGSGTIYATQDINVSSNFLPLTGMLFPTTTRMGLIAGRNMGLATGNGDAQLSMAGAFYAQGKVTSRKQNQIAGTFVANFFDMGTNVPNIYQVPTLSKNMPPAMPGDDMFFTLRVRTWRSRTQSEIAQ